LLNPLLTQVQRDRVKGVGPIKLDGHEYEKGMVFRPGCTSVLDLGGEYKELKAVIGLLPIKLDDRYTADSRVEVTVEADNRVLLKQAVAREDRPRAVTLDARGVRQLRITVTTDPVYRVSTDLLALADAKVTK
jgi:hypothetical protein